jgi:hypothetical protein
MKLKKGLIALLAMIVITLPLFTSACNMSGLPDGTVDHKGITGTIGNNYHSILLNRPIGDGAWILVKDDDFASYFSDSDKNAVISDTLAQLMDMKYSEIHYFVSVLSEDGESAQAYEVSRETFNRLGIGDTSG